MKEKYVIRLNRKNERLNGGWLFLIIVAIVVTLSSIIATLTTKDFIIIWIIIAECIIILTVAVMYQGFEVIRE